jgi:hypothetical protein
MAVSAATDSESTVPNSELEVLLWLQEKRKSEVRRRNDHRLIA